MSVYHSSFMFRFHALSVKALIPDRYPKLDQLVNAVGWVIWSMLIGLSTIEARKFET